jgi:hypothetical protein
MNYEVRHPEIEILLREIGHDLKDSLPQGWGFMLLLFGYGADQPLFYISASARADMIEALRQTIHLLEREGPQ